MTKSDAKLRRAQLYYSYVELRWWFWNYIKKWGKEKAREIYDEMVAEEGEEWAIEVLGTELREELCS